MRVRLRLMPFAVRHNVVTLGPPSFGLKSALRGYIHPADDATLIGNADIATFDARAFRPEGQVRMLSGIRAKL
jgi:hypothetical protein